MSLRKVLKELDFSPEEKEIAHLKKQSAGFLKLLKKHIAKAKIDADIFLGGSFAKGTLAKKKEYDIDIFVRFDKRYDSLSDLLEKVMEGVVKENKLKLKKLHGSRDYFQIEAEGSLSFEIIPVLRIKKVREARNVTDLSYFHVAYVKKKLKKKMGRELSLLKQFCIAQESYGAESYIGGFSGYALECLIIYYGTFEKNP